MNGLWSGKSASLKELGAVAVFLLFLEDQKMWPENQFAELIGNRYPELEGLVSRVRGTFRTIPTHSTMTTQFNLKGSLYFVYLDAESNLFVATVLTNTDNTEVIENITQRAVVFMQINKAIYKLRSQLIYAFTFQLLGLKARVPEFRQQVGLVRALTNVGRMAITEDK